MVLCFTTWFNHPGGVIDTANMIFNHYPPYGPPIGGGDE